VASSRDCYEIEEDVRIRSTKPEFWKSRRITSVSWDARLVLKGLESYVDDNGVGIDDIELIVSDVFPRDMFARPRETVARVSEAITELYQAGLVHRYEAGSDHLLYIAFWEEVQRIDKPGKGRNPRPDGTFDYKESSIRESVASPPETLAPGTEEQGNRGTGEQGNRGKKLSNDQTDSQDCNAREFSQEEMDEVKEILSDVLGRRMGDLEVSVAVELITEAAAEPVQYLPAYIRASVEQSRDRIYGLTREAVGQVARLP